MHVRDMYFQTQMKIKGGDLVGAILFVPNVKNALVETDCVSIVMKNGAFFDVVKDQFSQSLVDAVKEYNGSSSAPNVEEPSTSDSSTE